MVHTIVGKRIKCTEVMLLKAVCRSCTAFSLIGLLLALGIWMGRSVSAFAGVLTAEPAPCVILDAGHGGEDGGTSASTGKVESSYNLEITLRLRDFLHLLGYRTKLIRETDTSVYTHGNTIAQKKISDLKNRVRVIETTSNAILVSIHQNFYTDSQYHGAQVFYGNDAKSKALAELMQVRLCRELDTGNHRKCKKGEGIYLLEKTTCPRILVECGFLSNPQEAALLATEAYQKKLSAVIAASVAEYLTEQRISDKIK